MRIQTKKTAVLETIDALLYKAKVTKKLRGNIIDRVANGLDSREGEFVDSEFVYELIYAFKVLVQHGLSHYGKRPGRKFEPVDIETFVCGSLYMDQKEYVRPAILHHLKRLFSEEFEHCYEVLESGAIGYGKNYFADMAQAYILYGLSSFYSPQVEFGLAPGSDIIMMQQSVTTKLAKKVVFGQFGARLALSPYFTNHFPFDKRVRTELRFPENITVMPISSSSTAALSMNIYGGCFPATQTFVTGSGLRLLSETGLIKNCLTIDELSCIYGIDVRVVPTGYKSLVRMVFDNGEQMVCTPDQKFKTVDSNWKEAEDAAGCTFKFVKMPFVRGGCNLSDSTSEISTQYNGESVQKDVSIGEALREKTKGTKPKQERENSFCDLLGVRRAVSNDKREASEFSQYDCEGVPCQISQRGNVYKRDKKGLVREVQKARATTTPGPEVQESITAGNKESNAFSTSKKSGTCERPHEDKKDERCGESEVERVFCGEEGKHIKERSGRKDKWPEHKEASLFLHKSGGIQSENGLKTRDDNGVLAGFSVDNLGVRARLDTLPKPERDEILCTGLQTLGKNLSGGKRGNCSSEGQKLGVQTGSGARLNSSDFRDSKSFGAHSDIQLDKQQKDKRCILDSSEFQIQEIKCIKVESLGAIAPVYDIEYIAETHAFLTPTSTGVGSLVAHNCIDELSFMQKVKKSKRAEAGDLDYDQAEKLYNVVLRRMESRAILLGRIPGKLFLLGSANYVGDFIDRKLTEVKLLKKQGKVCPIYSMHMAQWEAYPEGTFCGEKFKVILPSEKTGGAVLSGDDKIDEDAEIKEIPIEYKSKFERDFEGSLKDIAGIPVGRLGRFIRDIRKVYICAEKHDELFEGRQLFITDEISQRQWHDIDDVIDFNYINEYTDKDTRLGAHIDLSITGDCCGIGIGHVLGFVKLRDKTPALPGVNLPDLGTLPIIVIDGTLSILPPTGGEIDLFMVRDLILRLGELTNVVFTNLDSYESAMMIQSFRQNRISSHVRSVDRTPEPYKDMKDAALGGRLLIPNSPKLIREIKMLGFDRAAKKIDHLQNESKDMADCVAGVVTVFSHLRSSFRGAGTGRPTITVRPSGTALPISKTAGRRIQLGALV